MAGKQTEDFLPHLSLSPGCEAPFGFLWAMKLFNPRVPFLPHFCPISVPCSLSPRLSHSPSAHPQAQSSLNQPCSQEPCANPLRQSGQSQNCSTGRMWLLPFFVLNGRSDRSPSTFFRKEFLLSPGKRKEAGWISARLSLPGGQMWTAVGRQMFLG